MPRIKKKFRFKLNVSISLQTEVEGQNVPTPVKSLARFKVLDISMGSHHTAVIVEPGCYVYMFGQNSEGQLGIGNTKSTTGPVKMQALSNEKVLVSILGVFFGGGGTES